MQFEDFDKKVKQAADHHHPPYDEQAWTKMEKLLNKHLPQKEDDKRRFIFFILLFLGLGGAGLVIFKPWKKAKQPIVAEQTALKQSTIHSPTTTNPENKGTTGSEGENDKTTVVGTPADNNDATKISSTTVPPVTINVTDAVVPGKESGHDPLQLRKNHEPVAVSFVGKTQNEKIVPVTNKNGLQQGEDTRADMAEKKQEYVQPVKSSDLLRKDATTTVAKKQPEPVVEKTTVVNSPKPTEAVNDKTPDSKKEDVAVAKENNDKKKEKSKSKKTNSFFFSLSAGPDMSFVKNNKAGEVKLLTGLGLGYTFKDRLTVRTGFYTGRKVYSANPDAYDPPAAFYSLYPYLEKVDANCKVYEIPVSLSYNMGKKKNWFVSTGLSTFLMKEETYNYFYKYTPQGNTYSNKWTIRNKNAHFFSVATISGGYKKDISKRVTLTAEPYLKVPFAGGVGYGKVKLNSGGILFTVGIKPF